MTPHDMHEWRRYCREIACAGSRAHLHPGRLEPLLDAIEAAWKERDDCKAALREVAALCERLPVELRQRIWRATQEG